MKELTTHMIFIIMECGNKKRRIDTCHLLNLPVEIRCIICDILEKENDYVTLLSYSHTCRLFNNESKNNKRYSFSLGNKGYSNLLFWIIKNQIDFDLSQVFTGALESSQNAILSNIKVSKSDNNLLLELKYSGRYYSVIINSSYIYKSLLESRNLSLIGCYSKLFGDVEKREFVEVILFNDIVEIFANVKNSHIIDIFTNRNYEYDIYHFIFFEYPLDRMFINIHQYGSIKIQKNMIDNNFNYRSFISEDSNFATICTNYEVPDLMFAQAKIIRAVNPIIAWRSYLKTNYKALKYCIDTLGVQLTINQWNQHQIRKGLDILLSKIKKQNELSRSLINKNLWKFTNYIWPLVYHHHIDKIDYILNFVKDCDSRWSYPFLSYCHLKKHNIREHLLYQTNKIFVWLEFVDFILWIKKNEYPLSSLLSFSYFVDLIPKLKNPPDDVILEEMKIWYEKTFIPLLINHYGSSNVHNYLFLFEIIKN